MQDVYCVFYYTHKYVAHSYKHGEMSNKNDYPERWITWLVGRWRTQLIARQLVNCRTHEHRHFERTLRSSDSVPGPHLAEGRINFKDCSVFCVCFCIIYTRIQQTSERVGCLTCKFEAYALKMRDILKRESGDISYVFDHHIERPIFYILNTTLLVSVVASNVCTFVARKSENAISMSFLIDSLNRVN